MRQPVSPLWWLPGIAALAVACASEPLRQEPVDGGATPVDGGVTPVDAGTTPVDGGTTPTEEPSGELAVQVSSDPTFLELAGPSVVKVSDAQQSTAWDLSFVDYDIFTNGGLSGPGNASAFGPLSVSVFAFPDQPVDVPFLISDQAGSPFDGWYAYDENTHTLYSRYHVYGVQSGGRLYKLQILGYYAEQQGSQVSALYQLRYAEVTADGSGKTLEISDLDATLAGGSADSDAPGACLSLATGKTTLLSPQDAADSMDWDLCFRRDTISVNGGVGGPGAVAGADLDAAESAGEMLADVEARTADTQQAAFDAVDGAALTSPDLEYRGDFVVSAFTDEWVDFSMSPPVPTPSAAFLVVAADGQSRFLVAFDAFDDANAETPGTVHLRVEPVASP
jgi:hypothetical protein